MFRSVASRVSSELAGYWQALLIYPALSLYIFSNDINLIGQQSLVYRKICLHEFNESVCDALETNSTSVSNRVHELTSDMQIVLNVAFMAPACLAIVYLFSLADRHLNYQLPLVVSLVGSLAQALVCVFAVKAEYDLAVGLLIASQFVNGICGAGSLAFISACFSHVANYENYSNRASLYLNNDNADDNQSWSTTNSQQQQSQQQQQQQQQQKSHRSIRYSICESCLLLGQFAGSLSSGHLIGNKRDLDNFQRVYILSFGIYALVLVYILIMFRYLKYRTLHTSDSWLSQSSDQMMSLDTSRYLKDNETNNNTVIGDETIQPVVVEPARPSFLRKHFRFVWDTWQLVSRPRANNARFLIIALLFMFFLGCSISMGIMSLQYQYLIKRPIHMSQVDYGYFKAANTACRAIALLVVLPLLKRLFHTPDYVLFLLGFTSEFLNLVVFSVAYFVKLVIWFAPVAYMFSNYFVVCIRSYSSRLVDPHETGKYFGLIAVTEFLVLLTSSNLFYSIYRYTLALFQPLVFLLGCAICILVGYPFLIYVIRVLRKHHLSDTETPTTTTIRT